MRMPIWRFGVRLSFSLYSFVFFIVLGSLSNKIHAVTHDHETLFVRNHWNDQNLQNWRNWSVWPTILVYSIELRSIVWVQILITSQGRLILKSKNRSKSIEISIGFRTIFSRGSLSLSATVWDHAMVAGWALSIGGSGNVFFLDLKTVYPHRNFKIPEVLVFRRIEISLNVENFSKILK